jgi:flagellar biosynthesis protein FlhG
MKAERKDQAAKLRELALKEQDTAVLQDGDSNVAVLDMEPDAEEFKTSTLELVRDKTDSKKVVNGVVKTDASPKKVDGKKTVESTVKAYQAEEKQDRKKQEAKAESNEVKERITMDLPVYSQEEAAKVILPSKKNNSVLPKPKTESETKPVAVAKKPEDKHEAVKPKEESIRADVLQMADRFRFEKTTQVIAVSGGKGGVGKSNIACNLGIVFSRMGKNVLLMDADLSLANIDVLLGMTPKYNISHVISGEKEVNEVILPGPGGMKILPGGSGVEELAHLSPESMSRLFNSLAKLDPVPDVFLLDTAAGIHPNVLQFVMAADQVIVVTTPEPTAYVDAYALIKTLVNHDVDKEIGLLINMARDSREALHVTRLLLQLCRTALKTGFNNLGFIPRDEEVLKAVRNQQAFLLRNPNSPASKALKNIASTIMQIEPKMEKGQGITGFFRRMFSARQPDKKAAGS